MINNITYFTNTGNISALREFIKNNHDLIFHPVLGIKGNISLLHVAARHGDIDTCKHLIDRGISINSSTDTGITPLTEAAAHGKVQTMQWLLENGAFVDGTIDSVASPLLIAVIEGHIDAVKLLIRYKAEINRLHLKFNLTSLDEAKIWKRDEIFYLIKSEGGLFAREIPSQWEGEIWFPIISHINDTLGQVFSLDFFGDKKIYGVNLRAARINNKDEFKLLFTVGLYAVTSPKIELLLVIPNSWPINDWAVQNGGVYSFPQKLLSTLANEIKNQHQIQAGYTVSSTASEFKNFIWPDSIKSLIVTDVCWTEMSSNEKKIIHDDEKVTLLTLAPCKKYEKPTANFITSWLMKHKYSKISKFSIPMPGK